MRILAARERSDKHIYLARKHGTFTLSICLALGHDVETIAVFLHDHLLLAGLLLQAGSQGLEVDVGISLRSLRNALVAAIYAVDEHHCLVFD